jgi:hypothetical protein
VRHISTHSIADIGRIIFAMAAASAVIASAAFAQQKARQFASPSQRPWLLQ